MAVATESGKGIVSMEVQHVRVKLPLISPSELDLDGFVRVFHRWIQEDLLDDLLIDVADYRHVHHGPAILLIAHEADYGVDSLHGCWGLHYNRKAAVPGENRARYAQAIGALLDAAARLEAEPQFDSALRFSRRELELTVNDRALVANTPASFTALLPDLEGLLASALGHEELTFEHASAGEPRDLLRVVARSDREWDPAALRASLATGG